MQISASILENLDRFIRKYYKNKVIKGVIYAVALLLSLFLVIALLEYFGYFGTKVRMFLFWFYIVVGFAVIIHYVLIPFAKMFRLGKIISYEEAADIIGNHFPEVNDKLLNLLELHKDNDASSDELLNAAILQKTAQLTPIPFHHAINTKANSKYVKYALIPLVVILSILFLSPTLLTEPSRRITHYTTQFSRPAPFTFVVENPSLEVVQQDDFELHIEVRGEAVPSEAFINIDGNVYKMQQLDKTHYSYLFKTVHHDCLFHLEAAEVRTDEFLLKVFPKPSIVEFQTLLSYPAYTQRTKEVLSNEGNLVVPQGTLVTWIFRTKEVDSLSFIVNDKVYGMVPDENGRISHTMRVMQSCNYGFTVSNDFSNVTDTLSYSVTSIEDAFPSIVAMEMQDSSMDDVRFFSGRIRDDYGFSKFEFRMVKTNPKEGNSADTLSYPIYINSELVQNFHYSVNLSEIQLSAGDRLEYFFQVWDNDGINGSKSVTSQHFELAVPTEKELDAILDRNSVQAQETARSSMRDLKKMQEEINDLMRKLVGKKDLNWQDKNDLQELAKKQEQVKNMLQQMQQRLNESKKLETKYKEQSEQLLEKQKELDRLMNEILTEKMKEMMKQMDEMMKQMDKKKVQQELEQLKYKNEDLAKQLDQDIELMKRLELEKRVESAIQKAETLAQEQHELSQKSSKSNNQEDADKQLKSQQELSQQYDELRKELNNIDKEYKDLDDASKFNLDQKLMQSIDKHQSLSEDNLRKGKQKDASNHQKEAAEQLNQLSEQLAETQLDMEQEELAEDAELIRQLLKNLLSLSFDQESLINTVGSVYIQDPKYQLIIAKQNKIKDDFSYVEDSLRSIAKRQVQVASVVNRNLADVNSSVRQSLDGLLNMNQAYYGNYKNTQSSSSMQYAMTSFNNLALVLAESLDQMQNQMRQNSQKKKSGSCKNTGRKKQGNCSNPGSGKPSPKSMKEMQQELNKQMEALKKQLEQQGKNNNPGKRKSIGNKANSQMSEEFARMAAQQEMIRKMMQDYGQELKNSNAGNTKLAREIDQMMKQMESTERDLVNKVITQQTINRQQQILSRMLEHENAELEREKEEIRQSREGGDIRHRPSPVDLEKLKKLQNTNVELYRTSPPTLSPYYKNKVDNYFYRF